MLTPKALCHLQALKDDGIVRELKFNLERLEWLKAPLFVEPTAQVKAKNQIVSFQELLHGG